MPDIGTHLPGACLLADSPRDDGFPGKDLPSDPGGYSSPISHHNLNLASQPFEIYMYRRRVRNQTKNERKNKSWVIINGIAVEVSADSSVEEVKKKPGLWQGRFRSNEIHHPFETYAHLLYKQ